MSDEELQYSFRQLIVQVADGLNDKNCQNIEYLHKLNMPKEDIQGLKIMVELEKRDDINYKEPDKLIRILSDLNRKDLVKLVTGYRDGPLKSSGIKRSGRKGSKHKPAAENDMALKSPISGNIIPATLMTILHINGHTIKLLDEVQRDVSGISRKNEAALTDVKNQHKKLSNALKKCIKDFQENQPQQNQHALQPEATSELTKKKPIPPPKPKKEFFSSESSSDFPNISTSPSEDDVKLKPVRYRLETRTDDDGNGVLENCTGDSGFGGEEIWERTVLPTIKKPRAPVISEESSKKGESDGPVYDDPWPTQETENYEELKKDLLEQSNEYTNIP